MIRPFFHALSPVCLFNIVPLPEPKKAALDDNLNASPPHSDPQSNLVISPSPPFTTGDQLLPPSADLDMYDEIGLPSEDENNPLSPTKAAIISPFSAVTNDTSPRPSTSDE